MTLNPGPAGPLQPTGPARCRRGRCRAPSPRSPASTTWTTSAGSPTPTTWNSLELTGALDDPAAVILDPGRRKQHQQERLAAAASQPLARIARLYWDDAGLYLRDPGGFRQLLRPACRRCTARRGIAGPIACRLPPHQTVCRRHRLWTGPAARTHAAQLDVSPFPEILRAQRRHLAQLHHHPWQDVETTISAATRAIYHALRGGTWIPGQRQRLRQLAPGTWPQAVPGGAGPGRQDDLSGGLGIEIAIYPEHRLARRAQPPGARHQLPRGILKHQDQPAHHGSGRLRLR